MPKRSNPVVERLSKSGEQGSPLIGNARDYWRPDRRPSPPSDDDFAEYLAKKLAEFRVCQIRAYGEKSRNLPIGALKKLQS
jgi:hypothetical protein